MLFSDTPYATFTDVPYQSQMDRGAARNTQLCTILAVAAVVVVVLTMMPLGCPQYAGGPRQSLLTAMHATAVGSEAKVSHCTELHSEKQVEDHIAKHDCTIMVYADWCSHCTSLADLLSELRKMTPAQQRAPLVTVNGDKIPKLCKKWGIQGYPTCLEAKQGHVKQLPHDQRVLLNACVGKTGEQMLENLQKKKGKVAPEDSATPPARAPAPAAAAESEALQW